MDSKPEIIACTTWDAMITNENILRSIFAYGFDKPSPIQGKAIPILSQGKDLIAQAQSGTGKTAAFSVGALTRIDFSDKNVQALIIAPTHELARQISSVCAGISSLIHGSSVKCFVGGSSVSDDLKAIENDCPQVVVGTPGRIFDLIRRRYLETSYIKILIIDEADEMLSVGFKDQIQDIFKTMPESVQTAIFSATMNRDVIDLTKRFMIDPVLITVNADKLTLDGIKQYAVMLNNDGDKFDLLKRIFGGNNISACVIYCNTVERVEHLVHAMSSEGFVVSGIHSKMSKQEREVSMKQFRVGDSRFLISSDLTARGIDVQQVGVVINFDITKNAHTYLHRIGRSGRWGRKGTAINFATYRDRFLLEDIEKYYNTQILPMPDNLTF
jgi:translation initiation factor 4A